MCPNSTHSELPNLRALHTEAGASRKVLPMYAVSHHVWMDLAVRSRCASSLCSVRSPFHIETVVVAMLLQDTRLQFASLLCGRTCCRGTYNSRLSDMVFPGLGLGTSISRNEGSPSRPGSPAFPPGLALPAPTNRRTQNPSVFLLMFSHMSSAGIQGLPRLKLGGVRGG